MPLIDFERLNEGYVPFAAVAVDIETGEEILIDTAKRNVTPDHIRASAARRFGISPEVASPRRIPPG